MEVTEKTVEVDGKSTVSVSTNLNSGVVVVTKQITEENKSLFNFRKQQLLDEGFKIVGGVKEEEVKSFWNFFTGGPKVIYSASFTKQQV